MRMRSLEKELDNLAHTLIDLKTIEECCKKTLESIAPRISLLEDRMDRFATELAKEREHLKRRREDSHEG